MQQNKLFTILFFISLIFFELLFSITGFPVIAALCSSISIYFVSSIRFSVASSLALAIVGPLSVIGLVEMGSKYLPGSFTLYISAVFILIITISGFIVVRSKLNVFTSMTKPITALLSLMALIPGLVTLVFLYLGGNISGNNLSWIIKGDAQTNYSSMQQIIENNGFPGGLPVISQGLMAAAVAGNIGFEISSISFVQILQIQAQILAVLWVLVSILFGAIAAKELSHSSLTIRALGTLLAATVPLSWFVLGFSIEAGFYNTTVALIALLCSWIFWRELENLSPKFVWAGIATLALSTFFALIAWTPLAIIPGSFLLFAIIQLFTQRMTNLKNLFLPILIIGLILVPVSVFALLPVLSEIGTVAGADGYMAPLPPELVVAAFFLSVLLALLTGFKLRNPGEANLGLVIFGFASMLGILFLLVQSFELNETLNWSYYPRKMAWMTTFTLMFLTIALFSGSKLISRITSPLRRTLALTTGMGLLLTGFLSTPLWGTGPLKVFPLMDVAITGQDTTGLIPAIESSIGKKTIRLDFDENDYLVNQWVFQWEKHKSQENMWHFAYSLIKSPTDVCDAATQWGGEVTFMTNSTTVLNQTLEMCSEEIGQVVSDNPMITSQNKKS